MSVIEVNGVAYAHPGGDELFADVSFRVRSGAKAGLVGANGIGKSTLFRVIVGELDPVEGHASCDGAIAYMPQAIGVGDDADTTVRELLARFASPRVAAAAAALHDATVANDEAPSDATGIALAEAYHQWGEVEGYEEEARWDACCQLVLRQPLDAAGDRPISQLSGGERKRLVLESLFAGSADVLLLDEPDNYLDLSAKRWLERRIQSSRKTVFLISHDRELLTSSTDTIVTMEGFGAWVHPGSFATYDEARAARNADLEERLARWNAEERRLFGHYKTMKARAAANDGNARRANAAESRWKRFVEVGPPPPPPKDQFLRMRLGGARSGDRVLMVEGLEIVGLTEPFSVELFRGDRVALLGPNGSGKSHFLRLLGGDDTVEVDGGWRTGASVTVGLFHQTDEVGWLADRTPLEALGSLDLDDGAAMSALGRYGLAECARRPFDTLSGGQKARMQVLGLELRGVNLLLLDEPTDNLDLESAEALTRALDQFAGTVLCVTHDRWFMRSFDRYLVFDHACAVQEVLDLDSALHLVTLDDGYPLTPSSVMDLTVAGAAITPSG
jgi:ATPase subunit of ABC transporter with duplicated ATPase domains